MAVIVPVDPAPILCSETLSEDRAMFARLLAGFFVGFVMVTSLGGRFLREAIHGITASMIASDG